MSVRIEEEVLSHFVSQRTSAMRKSTYIGFDISMNEALNVALLDCEDHLCDIEASKVLLEDVPLD